MMPIPEIRRFDREKLSEGSTTSLKPEAVALLDEAYATYRSKCFWNCRPTLDRDGLLAAARTMKENGNLKAWKMAVRLEELARDAGR